MVVLQVHHERFTLQGTRVIDPGFTTVMHWLGPSDESALPDIREGTTLDISSCKIAEKKTTPPGYLTEVRSCCGKAYLTITRTEGRVFSAVSLPTSIPVIPLSSIRRIDSLLVPE